jgi:Regulator of chromosome condensation (RCC1) repeat
MASEVVSSSLQEEDISKKVSVQETHTNKNIAALPQTTNISSSSTALSSTPTVSSSNSGEFLNQQQQVNTKFIRPQFQRRNNNSDPIIAPGFGTAKDINRLAQQLSDGSDIKLTSENIICMMKSRGTSATRRSTRGQSDENAEAAAAATASASTGAWADFMKEEGGVVDDTATSNKKRDQPDPQSSDTAKVQEKKAKVTATTSTATTSTGTNDDDDESTERHYGVLCQTGTLDSAIVGRKKGNMENPPTYNLLQPTRILPIKIRIRSVHTSSNACHSVAISTTNVVYGWGRNEYNQLSNTLPVDVPVPTILHDLPKSSTFISAATGKSHTLFLDTSGSVYSIGSNKLGQCGIKTNTDTVTTYKKCIFQYNNEVESDLSIKQVRFFCNFDLRLHA